MQANKIQYRGFLIIGMVITIIMMENANYTDAQAKSSETFPSIQQKPEDIKPSLSIEFDFRPVGAIITKNENSYAIIEDKSTGKQGIYKSGTSIKNEATLIKVDKNSIIVEKNGITHVLKIKGGNYSVEGPYTLLAPEELPFFEPIFSETGPPAGDKVIVKELPHFEPVTNSTGPPVDPEVLHKDLPEFEPFESDTGPSGM